MAWSNILNLDTPIAHRLIRCLYTVALVVIAIVTVMGVARGVILMTRPAPISAAASAAPTAAPPAAATGQPAPPTALPAGPRGRPFFRPRRLGGPLMSPIFRGAPPALVGLVQIVLVLLRALVMLLVVRILAEMGLSVLAMGGRARPAP
jgi:hypothetical protein